MTETVLIVDDEDSVRRTFHDWLAGSGLAVEVFAVADAEGALLVANDRAIDLAILDWNLGSGSDGLRLLEDLVEFHPDIVAILVTGYAAQATPLDALRKGVRDYLDKNHELNRDSFLAAVRRQLDKIAPAKRQRALNTSLAAFREAVEKVLPLVRATAALNDPLPLPDAVRGLFRFALRGTGATDGALVVWQIAADGTETRSAYAPDGRALDVPAVPFSRTIAASAVSHQEPCVMTGFDPSTAGMFVQMPFEVGRKTVLAVALPVGAGVHVVMELFDKPAGPFDEADRRLAAEAAAVGADLLRQALAERQTHRLLFDAVGAALTASREVSAVIDDPPPAVMQTLKAGLAADANAVIDADTGLELVQAVRALAVRHGPPAVEYSVKLVTDLHRLLDAMAGG